ncbi:ergosterol biosynthesis ERG4/ERG24 family-domain-containing protein [Chytridium lagenaria]|nr:ergosterol biosynthesis ERG4/ERG24 family-domain-containing protein [Chytridium lagenaria]
MVEASMLACFYQVFEVYALCVIFHKVIPAVVREGYCCDFKGNKLSYRLNGLAVLLAVDGTYGLLCWLGLKDASFLADNFLSCSISGVIIGILASIAFFIRGYTQPPIDVLYSRCVTADMVASGPSTGSSKTPPAPTLLRHPALVGKRTMALDFWNGFEFNPRVFGVDIKMMLYCWGATLLHLNLLSIAARHVELNGGMSFAMGSYVAMLTVFLVEYNYFEHVHLYTYDLFAEKIGFKLLFGCLGFYPFVYCIGGTVLYDYAPSKFADQTDISPAMAVLTVMLYCTGWLLTRGPNMQKYYFKLDPQYPTFLYGLIPQRALPGTRIVVSGFWGMSRHINYLGEITQSVALAIPCFLVTAHWGLALVPWIYPLYYVGLFVPRERDDHEICKKKYGKDWDTYCRLVPWRIVPYVY